LLCAASPLPTRNGVPEGFQSGRSGFQVSLAPKAEVGGFAQAAIGVPGAVWGEACGYVHSKNAPSRTSEIMASNWPAAASRTE